MSQQPVQRRQAPVGGNQRERRRDGDDADRANDAETVRRPTGSIPNRSRGISAAAGGRPRQLAVKRSWPWCFQKWELCWWLVMFDSIGPDDGSATTTRSGNWSRSKSKKSLIPLLAPLCFLYPAQAQLILRWVISRARTRQRARCWRKTARKIGSSTGWRSCSDLTLVLLVMARLYKVYSSRFQLMRDQSQAS